MTENVVNTIISQTNEGISPNFAWYELHLAVAANTVNVVIFGVFGFIDLLISFWDQRSKVKVTATMTIIYRINTICS